MWPVFSIFSLRGPASFRGETLLVGSASRSLYRSDCSSSSSSSSSSFFFS